MLFRVTRAGGSLEDEQKLIDRLLFSSNNSQGELYDYRVRPRGKLHDNLDDVRLVSLDSDEEVEEEDDGPVRVSVNMYLRCVQIVWDAYYD